MHTTNYQNTFIEIAEDCPVKTGEVPAQKKDEKTIAGLQFDMIYDNPYKYTSDDIVFGVHAMRSGIVKKDLAAERTKFFSKGQPCLRSSALGKRYGWGLHHDANGKVAMYAAGTPEYKKLAGDKKLKQVKAMRSKK